jgi:hypothetical protein
MRKILLHAAVALFLSFALLTICTQSRFFNEPLLKPDDHFPLMYPGADWQKSRAIELQSLQTKKQQLTIDKIAN